MAAQTFYIKLYLSSKKGVCLSVCVCSLVYMILHKLCTDARFFSFVVEFSMIQTVFVQSAPPPTHHGPYSYPT